MELLGCFINFDVIVADALSKYFDKNYKIYISEKVFLRYMFPVHDVLYPVFCYQTLHFLWGFIIEPAGQPQS